MDILYGDEVILPETTMPELFQRLVQDDSNIADKPAIITDCKTVTYQELLHGSIVVAENLQGHLKSSSVEENNQDKIVVLLMPAGIERICSILALWNVQCAYLPLENDLPEERVKYLLNECKPLCILSVSKYIKENLRTAFDVLSVPVLLYEDLVTEVKKKYNSLNVYHEVDPLLAVIYTSGSTGNPKGVKLRTRNLLNVLVWLWKKIPMNTSSVGCHRTSLLFVDSIVEIFGNLFQGVSLVIPSKEQCNVEILLNTILHYKVTRLYLVPTLLQMMIAYAAVHKEINYLQSLRHIVSSGEILTPELAKQCFEILSDTYALWNLYGCTETTAYTTWAKLESIQDTQEKTSDNALSIGWPISNSGLLILDKDEKEVPPGGTGEICTFGRPIADGYMDTLRNDDFKQWISRDGLNHFIYKTGDMGKITSTGIVYLGRADSMIKIRGQRINLKEVDTILNYSNLVTLSVTQSIKTKITDEIVCFYSVEGSHESQEKANLEKQMHVQVRSMLPVFLTVKFYQVFTMPTLPSGKIDTVKLKEDWFNTHYSNTELKTSQGSIIDLISKHLGVSTENERDSKLLSEIGANSFNMSMLAANIMKKGYSIPLENILSCETIGDLKVLVRKLNSGHTADPVMVLPSNLPPDHKVKLVSSLKADQVDSLIKMMALSFTTNNPLDNLAKTPALGFEMFLRSFWQEVISDDLSICIENQSGEIIAALIALDIATEINPNHPFDHVIQINEDVEKSVRDRLLSSGERWVDSMLSAVDITLNNDLSVPLMIELENQLLQKAQERGYHGILAVNSHPVTMMIGSQTFGYKTDNKLHVKTWEYKEERPFIEADDDYYIYCMTKALKTSH